MEDFGFRQVIHPSENVCVERDAAGRLIVRSKKVYWRILGPILLIMVFMMVMLVIFFGHALIRIQADKLLATDWKWPLLGIFASTAGLLFLAVGLYLIAIASLCLPRRFIVDRNARWCRTHTQMLGGKTYAFAQMSAVRVTLGPQKYEGKYSIFLSLHKTGWHKILMLCSALGFGMSREATLAEGLAIAQIIADEMSLPVEYRVQRMAHGRQPKWITYQPGDKIILDEPAENSDISTTQTG